MSATAEPAADYGDVPVKIRAMAALPVGSAERDRLRQDIIGRCLPLAQHIARRYDGRGEPREDLIQTACLGLLNAVERFDPDAGCDFLSFAVPTMMGEVKRHFRDNGWSVHVPRRMKDRRGMLAVAISELSQRMGRAPTPTELAGHLAMSRQEVVETLIAAQCYQTRSLDAPVMANSDESPSIADRLGHVDSGIDAVEFREALRPLLAKLPQRQRDILTLRFFESLTQTQIAERLGVSQMHVSRLLSKSLNQLRAGLSG